METKNKIYDFQIIQKLKYGENPHQSASLYSYDKEIDWLLMGGGELTYNDILDSTLALEMIAEFFDVAAVVSVKHETPSVAALGSNIEDALNKALDSDPISPMGSVIALSKPIDYNTSKKISSISPKVVLAPNFEGSALEELQKNKELKIIKINTPLHEISKFKDEDIKLTPFGALIQEKNKKDFELNLFKVLTKKKPEQAELEDMIFASKIAKYTKSSAVVIAKDLRTIGICASETNRARALEIALQKVCDSPKGSIAASDGKIEAKDFIQILVQNRVSGVIQPAGSPNDKEIADYADKLGVVVVATGIRHFKH